MDRRFRSFCNRFMSYHNSETANSKEIFVFSIITSVKVNTCIGGQF